MDKVEDLVTDIGIGLNQHRSGDHTNNGIRLAIDGWIYCAMGDYGVPDAKDRGEVIQMDWTSTSAQALKRHDGSDLRNPAWRSHNRRRNPG